MSVLIQIFLLFCIMAQPQFRFTALPVQPPKEKPPMESENVRHSDTIYSLINGAMKNDCAVFTESKYPLLKEYCERPVPVTYDEKAYLGYDAALCMVLYDVANRVCEGVHPKLTKGSARSSRFSCVTMIKSLPETSFEKTKPWVKAIKAKFENISNCEQACMQGNLVNPLCEYILNATVFPQEAQVSTSSPDISHAGSPESQVDLQDHKKFNKTVTNKDKTSENKSFEMSSAVSSNLSTQSDGNQKTPHNLNKTKATDKSVLSKDVKNPAANGKHSHSGSENDVFINSEKLPSPSNTNEQNGTKNQAHTEMSVKFSNSTKQTNAGNGTQNTDNSVQNDGDRKEHTKNSNDQSTEVTSHNAQISLPEKTPEAEKVDDNKGKGISSGSKSQTALQPENKKSTDASGPDVEVNNENDNENSVMPAEKNDIKGQDGADVAGDDDDDQVEEGLNVESPGEQSEQSEQIPKETETHQEEAETGNIAQFSQIGDADDSHFYAYFMTMVVICIIGYLLFHNKQKILALALEGRSHRGTRRRPSTSAYRKLDSNLEEAVTSTRNTSVTHVIY